MNLSAFGEKFTRMSGILQLMDDLGEAASGGDVKYMLGGGNPAHIPALQDQFRDAVLRSLDSDSRFEHMVGDYPAPQGEGRFVSALANLLNRECGWSVGPENVALTNGSQTAFFFLFNLFAGTFSDGSHKKILFPLAPEYIGYADVGLSEDCFIATRSEMQLLGDHIFKYRIDFDALTITDDVGAICLSRPTNPTGNVITDNEIAKLRALARESDIPLILDTAYGSPFPGIIFTDAAPVWDEDLIVCMSLSKLGLPAAWRRTASVADSSPIW